MFEIVTLICAVGWNNDLLEAASGSGNDLLAAHQVTRLAVPESSSGICVDHGQCDLSGNTQCRQQPACSCGCRPQTTDRTCRYFIRRDKQRTGTLGSCRGFR